MLEFNKCCFCIPLSTGCLILGYLHLVASIFLALIYFVSVASVGVAMSSENVNFHIDQGTAVTAIAVYGILLLLVIAWLTFSILLVVGIHKEKRNYVKAYLIYYVIFIVLYSIVYIVKIFIFPFVLIHVLGTLIETLLSVYFLLVIRSYWVTMGDKSYQCSV